MSNNKIDDDYTTLSSSTTTIASSNNSMNIIRPFEWLTSPESLGDLINKHVISKRRTTNKRDNNTALSALHVGCGSSTVGEYLIQELHFDKVVNIDLDDDIMKQMSSRWENIATEKMTTSQDDEKSSPSSSNNNNNNKKSGVMEFITIDFTKQSLPEQYTNTFDLILDKSTLDCTLCSDTATASLLIEVYRTLSKSSGTYMVISFHELDLLLPLLQDLPGTNWTVEHTTMDRQVECLNTNSNNNNIQQYKSLPSSNQKPLNVLIAWCNGQDDDNHNHNLNFDDVCQHVHEVNDRWFQEQHPLLTEERLNDLQIAFGMQQQQSDDDAVDGDVSSNVLSLEEAFLVLFTQAEREHLTYEHFLEDWEAFINNNEANTDTNSSGSIPTTTITYQVAVQFLEQTQ